MAYYNKTINDGPYGSFQADPNGSGIGIYIRCKFAAPGGVTPDGKPILQICSATERADVITMQPIAAGAVGTVKFANGGGEQFGIVDSVGASAAVIYAAANGHVGYASGGGALLLGKATSPGSDQNAITYTNNIPAA